MDNKLASIFRQILKSDLFLPFSDWADFLFTSGRELEYWMSGVSLPESYQLHRFVNICNALKTIENSYLVEKLAELIKLPIEQVTHIPIKYKTLEDYMNSGEVRI